METEPSVHRHGSRQETIATAADDQHLQLHSLVVYEPASAERLHDAPSGSRYSNASKPPPMIELRLDGLPLDATKAKVVMAGLATGLSDDGQLPLRGCTVVQKSLARSKDGRRCIATVCLRQDLQGAMGMKGPIKGSMISAGHRIYFDNSLEGLTPLYWPLEWDTWNMWEIDIIALTGLAGKPIWSWKPPTSSDMWLRDWLGPGMDLEGYRARVFTFGYDSKVSGSESDAGISDYARQFLWDVHQARTLDPREKSRRKPTILIGHSIGGLILKRALRIAFDDTTSRHHDLVRDCQLAVLFGVPNNGMNIETLRRMSENQPNEKLISLLALGSHFLRDLDDDFHQVVRAHDLKMISIVELHDTPQPQLVNGEWTREDGPSRKLSRQVDWHSATSRGLGPVEVWPSSTNHSTMAKFDSPYNEIYLRLVSRFKNILEDQRKEGDRRRWINAPNRQQTPGFVGRNEILQKMHDYFHPVDTRDGKSPAENEEEESQTEMGGVFVLHGSPDLGKTRIALQYATKHDKSYSKIVWVRAGSSYEVLDSFRLAARSLELESPERGLIGAVFSKLSEIDGKILIVYDDLDVNMSALIHTEHERQWGPSTHVIITTNDRLSVRSLQVCATHVINSLSASEGHKLMRTMLHFQNSESDSDLTRLGEALGWHPLAIQQSVSYIDISALSVDRYLSTLSRAPKDVLFSELGYIDTGKSLEATFEQLLKRLGADDSFAVDWVSMCSYLGTKIDHDLFDLAQDFWSSGPVRAQESNAFSPTSDGWAELSWLFSDPSRSLESMWLRLSALGRFNVVKTHSTYWELPTLMALWIRHRHGDAPGQKHKHLARAVCFLHACAEQLRRAGAGNARRDTAAAYNAQLRLVHLANVCVRHCSDAIKKNIASIVPVECTVTLACWKIHAGDCNSAVDMLTVALDRETNPLSMIDLQRTLAWGLRRGCRAAEAVPYQLLAIESLERLQASNAASTADCVYEVLRARGELASIYREVPKKLKLNDAIELQKGIVTQTRELYGDNARQTIHEMSCLSSIYSTAVQLEKALAIDLEILEICRESRTSLEELMSQKEKLAVTYFDLHRFKDAIELQTEVMEWCRERYGEQHIETATALHRLAASRLHAEFELPLAHKMISSALDIRRKWLGDENDRTKKSAKLKEEIKKKQESIRHSGTVSRRVDSFNRGLEHRDSGFAM